MLAGEQQVPPAAIALGDKGGISDAEVDDWLQQIENEDYTGLSKDGLQGGADAILKAPDSCGRAYL